jgi:acetolactate decarboxylase
MNKSRHALLFVFLITVITSCESKVSDNKKAEVKYSGALKTIMSGNIQSTINLDSFVKKLKKLTHGADGVNKTIPIVEAD